MSKEESSPGLLSKMVRFVRNPTVNWTDLDSIEADRESQYSKQMLKEMIERKRRNDFVRRREFDQLRKLRQREALQGQRTEDPTARPSFFQSSMASSDERAVTLKKIDEIEAQMSQQWWKSKQGSDTSAGASAAGPAGTSGASGTAPAEDFSLPPVLSDTAHARAFAPTAPASIAAMLGSTPAVEPLFSQNSVAAATDMAALEPPAGTAMGGGSQSMRAAVPATPAAAPEPERFVHEPDLEEAAILFANGDHAGAEAGLRDVLAQHEHDDPEQQHEIWMTLFDLYRAIGEHEKFDTLAIDFAARFSRSAPLWFSMPGLLGLSAARDAVAAPVVHARDFSWSAASTLTLQSIAALNASTLRAASPWSLTWSRLTAIDEAAVPALADLFTQWADQNVQLHFFGVDALNSLLQARTQSGDRESNPQWWRLRMAALRLMGRPDEFELVALDYCVTYEVSPPSWVSPRCGYSGDDSLAAAPAATAEAPDSELMTSGFGLPQAMAPDEPVAVLSGHIEGDAVPLLEPFDAMVRPDAPLVIACDRLIRVDFAAAGSVLNWAAEQQAQGRAVHFTNVQRLVAVFFNVIGIGEHALVAARKN